MSFIHTKRSKNSLIVGDKINIISRSLITPIERGVLITKITQTKLYTKMYYKRIGLEYVNWIRKENYIIERL